MEVVHHHIGSPRNITIAQNEKMTRLRVRISSADSGGGCFLEAATTFASRGAAELGSGLLSLLFGLSVIVLEI